jgi:hypothetical protein
VDDLLRPESGEAEGRLPAEPPAGSKSVDSQEDGSKPTADSGAASGGGESPPDPLDGFAPCSPTGQGHGTVTSLAGAFAPPNRYIVIMGLTGQWGGHATGEALAETPGLFWTLFEGHYGALVDLSREFQGPVALTRLTARDGALKATIGFLENKAPASVKISTMCRGGELALIHDFSEGR